MNALKYTDNNFVNIIDFTLVPFARTELLRPEIY